VLEEYEHAKARGASIFAEVVGVGMNADAYHMTAPEPNGAGAAHVMELALQDASITPSQVDYINAHGTSTPLGDIAEVKAIKTVWGEDAKRLNISSTKSMTGHLMGATGAVEAAATIMALKEGVIPPTINHAEGDDDETIGNDLNFTFNLALDRPDPAADAAGVKYTAGFVHNVMYETYLKDHEAPEDIEYYMCGPGPMSKAVTGMLYNLGVEDKSIMYDNFGG
jgi:3-oxoacyl-[acyl-carrier-protein] synthase II